MGSRPLRIAVDARAAAEVPAGRGRYVRELVRALRSLEGAPELILLGRTPWPLPGTRWRLLPTPDPAWALHAGRAASRGCDVLLATNSYALCAASGVPAVAVVHDVVGFSQELGAPRGTLLERLTLPLAVRRAAGLICVSAATRDELVRRFPQAEGRTCVVHHGVDRGFGSAAAAEPSELGLDREYVLAVGTLEPRKNLPRLVEAFGSLPGELRERFVLALAGARGWAMEEIDAALGSQRANVRVLGYLPDEMLPRLYAGATALAYPSLEEGFGLPVLEAMAAGAPVLTSDRSSLPEVAGDAALLVDPEDVTAIRAGLEHLLTDEALRDELSRRGRERAAEFTWERTARQTLDYLTSVSSTLPAGNSRHRNVSS